MNISKFKLLLFIPFLSCINSNDQIENQGLLEPVDQKVKQEIVSFNTLIKGAGSPTIIFESGLGTPLNNWNIIQENISANYKTISYDRQGIGGTADTDSSRSIENLVSDLESLISQNEIEGPIVLLGHSLGGHIVRKYQQTFPSNIVGLFLIDPTHEYLYDEVFNEMSQNAADSMKTAWDNNFKKGSPAVYKEWKEVYNIDQEMRKCPLPSHIPITILASKQENSFLTKKNVQIKDKLFSDWKKDKENVKILYTKNSGHYIHLGEPEWVVKELETFLLSLK